MVSTARPVPERRQTRWISRAGAVFALTGTLALALTTSSTVAADVPLDKRSAPVRIQLPYAGIDLPVISSTRTLPGNAPGYPLCDVAQWLKAFQRPGAPGTTWIIGHAQPGMFLPLFTISEATDGKGLLGKVVDLQTRDGRLLHYRINEVRERSPVWDWSIAKRSRPNEQRLILQTSTGPAGTLPKLQAAATLIGAEDATERAPKAKPRVCSQPRQPDKKPRKNATPKPAETTDATTPMDAVPLVLGSGAVLLGATFAAVYVVRRQP